MPELVGLAVGDDRVPRIRAAVVAADEIRVLGEQIDDLALALVAPLGADDDGRGHGREYACEAADPAEPPAARSRGPSAERAGSLGVTGQPRP